MKITKFIDCSQEVDIELDSEDIRLILSESTDTYSLLINFSDILAYLMGISDSIIENIPEDVRGRIIEEFQKQLERYKIKKKK